MSTYNIPFSILKRKLSQIVPKTAVVNEPSVFEPLKFCFIHIFHFLANYNTLIDIQSANKRETLQYHFFFKIPLPITSARNTELIRP